MVSQSRINDYADASGDHNPIHLDENFSSQTRFGQRIAHGMLSLAFVWEMLVAQFPEAWCRGCTVKVRFTSPVLPGETVHVEGSVIRIKDTGRGRALECEVLVTRHNGESALAGTATVPIEG